MVELVGSGLRALSVESLITTEMSDLPVRFRSLNSRRHPVGEIIARAVSAKPRPPRCPRPPAAVHFGVPWSSTSRWRCPT